MSSSDIGYRLQVFLTSIDFKSANNKTEMFDLTFDPLELTTSNLGMSLSGFKVTMKRMPMPFVITTYVPTGLLTTTAFIGFVVPVDKVPGRMALLVTIFLMLVNISSMERNRGPAVRTSIYQRTRAYARKAMKF